MAFPRYPVPRRRTDSQAQSRTVGPLAAAAGAVTYDKFGAVAAGTLASAADVFEATETGAVTTGALLAGFASASGVKAGQAFAGTKLLGADVAEHAETGAVLAGTTLAGPTNIKQRTGTVAAATWGAGADAFTATETGKVLTAARFSGYSRLPPGPSGKFVLTNAYVAVAGVDVSNLCTQVEVMLEREPIDVTSLGAQYKEYMGGPTSGEFTIDLFADPTVFTPAFWALLDSPVTVEVHPRGVGISATNPSWTATATALKRVPLTGSVGDAAKATIQLKATTEVLETL